MKTLFRLLFVLAIVAALFFPTSAKAVTYTSYVATPATDLETIDAMYQYDSTAHPAANTLTYTASTTARTIPIFAGRDRMDIFLNGTGPLWVSVGTATAVVNSQGVSVSSQWEDIPIDANVAVSVIAATNTFTFSVVQYRAKQKKGK